MIKESTNLVKKMVSLDDLVPRTRKSLLEAKILDLARKVKASNKAAIIDGAEIRYSHFYTKVRVLKEQGKLDQEFRVERYGDTFALVYRQP